jgi:hypothetical protein
MVASVRILEMLQSFVCASPQIRPKKCERFSPHVRKEARSSTSAAPGEMARRVDESRGWPVCRDIEPPRWRDPTAVEALDIAIRTIPPLGP